jgi:hypothetical protein
MGDAVDVFVFIKKNNRRQRWDKLPFPGIKRKIKYLAFFFPIVIVEACQQGTMIVLHTASEQKTPLSTITLFAAKNSSIQNPFLLSDENTGLFLYGI